MKLRFTIYWLFLFVTFSIGSVYYHLCRYDNDVLNWSVEFKPLLLVMKIVFVTFLSVVFLLKTDVFNDSGNYKSFLMKNIAFLSPVVIVPMGVFYVQSVPNRLASVGVFSYLIGFAWCVLFVFSIGYLLYTKVKNNNPNPLA